MEPTRAYPRNQNAQASRSSSVLSHSYLKIRPEPGVRIANSKGIPGTLGGFGRTLHDGQIVLLSTWHVLFGNGARDGSAVWLVDSSGAQGSYAPIGRTLYGKRGVVHFNGEEHYIDCAVASCFHSPQDYELKPGSGGLLDDCESAQAGSQVIKTGAATGTTSGTVVAIDHSVPIDGRGLLAPAQILIRPVNRDQSFAAEGDSGALIVNQSNKVVGLLWGANTRGEGIACPIAPVLYALNITLTGVPGNED